MKIKIDKEISQRNKIKTNRVEVLSKKAVIDLDLNNSLNITGLNDNANATSKERRVDHTFHENAKSIVVKEYNKDRHKNDTFAAQFSDSVQ